MDCYLRSGGNPAAKVLPYIPGTAFAGVVEAVGEGVTNFQPGQAICGRTPNGASAQYTIVPVNTPAPSRSEPHLISTRVVPLALKPASWSFEEAATLSGGATTAWTSVFEDGGLQTGQRALIHGAAGGVGLFAVQFAKWKGAHVIATASTANVDFVRSLGADEVIDYTATPFEEVDREVDFVLDTIGGDTLRRSMHLVKRGGTLVSVVEVPPADLAESLGIRADINQVFPASEHLRQIVELIDEGVVRTAIREVFELKDAPLAHALCETGHGRGRIVLRIQ
jgi:NADPH:quinone reductase-like Zn-dependent oxidoreductase